MGIIARPRDQQGTFGEDLLLTGPLQPIRRRRGHSRQQKHRYYRTETTDTGDPFVAIGSFDQIPDHGSRNDQADLIMSRHLAPAT